MTKQQQHDLDAVLRQGQSAPGGDVPASRAAFEARMAQVPVPADIEQKLTTVGGVPGIEVAVNGTTSVNVILYFHGGVYVIGSARSSVALVGDLARRAGARAVTLDYRLAPEHPYPAAVDDAVAAYEGLLQQGIDPGRIALAGESAGGGLAIAALLTLKAAGRPMPSCAFLMSPYADLTLSGETMAAKEALDPVLSPASLRLRVPHYVADGDATDPRISPVFGDLGGLPPLLIQAGSHEVLLSDALRLAGRAAIADVPVVLDVTPGVPHVFQAFAAVLDEGGAALDRAAAFLNRQFAAGGQAESPGR